MSGLTPFNLMTTQSPTPSADVAMTNANREGSSVLDSIIAIAASSSFASQHAMSSDPSTLAASSEMSGTLLGSSTGTPSTMQSAASASSSAAAAVIAPANSSRKRERELTPLDTNNRDLISRRLDQLPAEERDHLLQCADQLITSDQAMSAIDKSHLISALFNVPSGERANVTQLVLQLIKPEMNGLCRAQLIALLGEMDREERKHVDSSTISLFRKGMKQVDRARVVKTLADISPELQGSFTELACQLLPAEEENGSNIAQIVEILATMNLAELTHFTAHIQQLFTSDMNDSDKMQIVETLRAIRTEEWMTFIPSVRQLFTPGMSGQEKCLVIKRHYYQVVVTQFMANKRVITAVAEQRDPLLEELRVMPENVRDNLIGNALKLIPASMGFEQRVPIIFNLLNTHASERDNVTENALLLSSFTPLMTESPNPAYIFYDCSPDRSHSMRSLSSDRSNLVYLLSRETLYNRLGNVRNHLTAQALQLISPQSDKNTKYEILDLLIRLDLAGRDNLIQHTFQLVTPEMSHYKASIATKLRSIQADQRGPFIGLALQLIQEWKMEADERRRFEIVCILETANYHEHFLPLLHQFIPLLHQLIPTELAAPIKRELITSVWRCSATRAPSLDNFIKQVLLLINPEMNGEDRAFILNTLEDIDDIANCFYTKLAQRLITPEMSGEDRRMIVEVLTHLDEYDDPENLVTQVLRLSSNEIDCSNRVCIFEILAAMNDEEKVGVVNRVLTQLQAELLLTPDLDKPKRIMDLLVTFSSEQELTFWTQGMHPPIDFGQLLRQDQGNPILLLNYLKKLKTTADYLDEDDAEKKTRKSIVLRVQTMLRLAIEKPEFNQILQGLLQEGSESCEDRAILFFNDIDVLSQRFLKEYSEKEWAHLAMKIQRYELLKLHAKKQAIQRGLEDQIETILFYQIALKTELSLPINPVGMLYSQMAQVSVEMIEAAKEEIMSISKLDLLAGSELWRVYLQKQTPDAFTAIEEISSEQLESLRIDLTSQEYADRCNQIRNAREESLRQRAKALTEPMDLELEQ